MAEEKRALLSSDGIITHKYDAISPSNGGLEIAQEQNAVLDGSQGQNGVIESSRGQHCGVQFLQGHNCGLDGFQGQNGSQDVPQGQNGGVDCYKGQNGNLENFHGENIRLDGSEGHNGDLKGSEGQNGGLKISQGHSGGLEISQGQNGGLEISQGQNGGLKSSQGHQSGLNGAQERNGGLESSLAQTDGPNAPQGQHQETSPLINTSGTFSFRRLSSRKKLTFLLLALTVFASGCCFSLLAPFFPTVAKSKGMSPTWIGLVLSCFDLWIFVSSPVFGMYISRFGAVRVFTAGQFVAGICSILFGFLKINLPGHVFMALCLLVRTVKALGASAIAIASMAVIAMEFPEHISTVFSIMKIFTGIGYIAGPMIGAALYEAGGFGLPFWVMGVFLLLCGLVTALQMPVSLLMPVRAGAAVGKKDGFMLPLISSPLSAVATLSVVFGIFSWSSANATLAIHAAQIGIGTTFLGVLFTIDAALYSLTSPFYGWLSDAKDITCPLLIYGNVAFGISLLIMGPSPLLPFLSTNIWLTVAGVVGMGLLSGACFLPAIKCLYIAATLKGLEKGLDLDGAVSGIFTSAYHLGGFMGLTIGSAVLETGGYGWSMTVNAFLLFFSALCVSVYVIATRTCHKRHDEDSKTTSPNETESQETLLTAP